MLDRFSHRLAVRDDVPALTGLMRDAIGELQKPFLTAEQIASSRTIMGLDTQLIDDGTYFVVEQAGVIEGYGARLDPRRLGLGLRAFVRVQLETHDADHVQRFAELVGSAEEVVACWSLTGEMDYLLQVAVTDLDHYNDFIMGRLLREGGVRDVNSSFVLGTIKPDQGLPLPARSD